MLSHFTAFSQTFRDSLLLSKQTPLPSTWHGCEHSLNEPIKFPAKSITKACLLYVLVSGMCYQWGDMGLSQYFLASTWTTRDWWRGRIQCSIKRRRGKKPSFADNTRDRKHRNRHLVIFPSDISKLSTSTVLNALSVQTYLRSRGLYYSKCQRKKFFLQAKNKINGPIQVPLLNCWTKNFHIERNKNKRNCVFRRRTIIAF